MNYQPSISTTKFPQWNSRPWISVNEFPPLIFHHRISIKDFPQMSVRLWVSADEFPTNVLRKLTSGLQVGDADSWEDVLFARNNIQMPTLDLVDIVDLFVELVSMSMPEGLDSTQLTNSVTIFPKAMCCICDLSANSHMLYSTWYRFLWLIDRFMCVHWIKFLYRNIFVTK